MKIYNLLIDNEIGGEEGITATYVREEIAKAKKQGAEEIRVIMNSPGGEVFEGYSIFNALKSAGIKVNTFVTGQCASIATLIACAGDSIVTSPVSHWMFHKPAGGARGNASTLIETATELEQIEQTMAQVYAAKMGKDIADGLMLMSKGNYTIPPKELLSLGFINSIATPPSAFIQNDITMIKNEKEAKNILARIFKAFAEEPTAGSIMLQDGSKELYFVGEEITSGTVLFLNPEMTETAPEGDHVLADGKIVTLDAAGAVVRVAEIEASVEEQIAEAVASAVEAAKAEMQAAHETEINALKETHTTAMAQVKEDVVALQALIVSDKPVAKARPVVMAKSEPAAKNSLDIQAQELARSMGFVK